MTNVRSSSAARRATTRMTAHLHQGPVPLGVRLRGRRDGSECSCQMRRVIRSGQGHDLRPIHGSQDPIVLEHPDAHGRIDMSPSTTVASGPAS